MKKTSSTTVAMKHGGSGGAHQLTDPTGAVVLHVDDDPNDTALLEAARRKAGVDFRLENVSDGDQAIAYLTGASTYGNRANHPWPSLILLDLKMPRATGFEILKWIRSHPPCKKLPVLVLSGSELQEDIRQAYLMGANSYLVKPLGFEALVSLVKNFTITWLAPRPKVIPGLPPESPDLNQQYRTESVRKN